MWDALSILAKRDREIARIRSKRAIYVEMAIAVPSFQSSFGSIISDLSRELEREETLLANYKKELTKIVDSALISYF